MSDHMPNPNPTPSISRPDDNKGVIEGDRPDDQQVGNPHGTGVDENGMPADSIATAEDREGANADETQG